MMGSSWVEVYAAMFQSAGSGPAPLTRQGGDWASLSMCRMCILYLSDRVPDLTVVCVCVCVGGLHDTAATAISELSWGWTRRFEIQGYFWLGGGAGSVVRHAAKPGRLALTRGRGGDTASMGGLKNIHKSTVAGGATWDERRGGKPRGVPVRLVRVSTTKQRRPIQPRSRGASSQSFQMFESTVMVALTNHRRHGEPHSGGVPRCV